MRDVTVVLRWHDHEIERIPGQERSLHVLTNSRSLTGPGAAEVVESAARASIRARPAARVILRGDSTLRGHLVEEYEALRLSDRTPRHAAAAAGAGVADGGSRHRRRCALAAPRRPAGAAAPDRVRGRRRTVVRGLDARPVGRGAFRRALPCRRRGRGRTRPAAGAGSPRRGRRDRGSIGPRPAGRRRSRCRNGCGSGVDRRRPAPGGGSRSPPDRSLRSGVRRDPHRNAGRVVRPSPVPSGRCARPLRLLRLRDDSAARGTRARASRHVGDRGRGAARR